MMRSFITMLFCCVASCLHAQKPAISTEVMADLMTSIPSPLEISFLIKDLEITYNKSLLTSTESIKNVKTPLQQAFLLGVLSTDVGYAQIYAKPDALTSLDVCQKITQTLQIDSVIDFKVWQKMMKDTKGIEDLLQDFVKQIESINKFLENKGKQELSMVMLTGWWLKSLYITCETHTKYPNEILKARISEQAIILEQFLLLLSFYDNDVNIINFIKKTNQLSAIYQHAEKNPDSVDIPQIHQQTKKILQEVLEGK